MSQQTAPQESIGPYTLDCLLGTGGMGEVYKAFDPRLDRWVAVKHIKPEYALKAGCRQRLEREAKTIASLDHPSIVQIFDVLQDDDGGEWIVMELVDGPTVYEMLDEGPLDLGTTLTIALDVIHGLGVAHDEGVLHRDLKSENVMVSRKGVAKILDFGLSKRLTQVDEATLSMEGKVIGTCRVMAPEQADGQELDGRADLFSFGILLYEMVTARSPFRASTPMASMLKAFGEPHAPVHDHNPDVPQELSDLIDRLLSKNRDHRPASALVVASELSDIAGDLTDNSAELAERIRMGSRSWHGSGALSTPYESTTTVEDPLDETVAGGPSDPYSESSRATRSSRMTRANVSRATASRAVEETMERSRLDLDARRKPPSESRFSSMFSAAFGLGLPPSRKALAWTAWLLAILTGWWGVSSMNGPVIPQEPQDARIVVLPFENHGPEEMGYFASGLTSELIRELTSRRGLAVVSYRTSKHYGSADKSLGDLQEELDVSHVLEGDIASDQEIGDSSRLRINLRLIRVSDGQVILSQSLDRTARDTLRVQSQIADDVSLELGAQVFADTRSDLSAEPRALEAFFHGLEIWHSGGFSPDGIQEAERYFVTAVEEDPSFVRAWTELARVRSAMTFNGISNGDTRAGAKEALARANELSPGTSGVQMASGYYRYHVEQNLEDALARFQLVARASPEDPEAQLAIGLVLRRLGRLSEAIEHLVRAFDLDRANATLAGVIAETERGRRAFRSAEKWFALAQRTTRDISMFVGERAENTLARLGCGESLAGPVDCPVESARQSLQDSGLRDSSSLWLYRVRIALFEMASGGSREQFLAIYDDVEESQIEESQRYVMYWRKVLVLRELGRAEDAEEFLGRYRLELEEKAANSEYWLYRAPLGMAMALAGDRDGALSALEKAQRAVQLDSFTGPRVAKWAAATSVVLGDLDTATKYLTACSQREYQQSLASYEIQADPIWEPLREKGYVDELWRYLREKELHP